MKNEKLKIIISIDDVNPLKHFRILGTKTEKWLEYLYKKFGVKFNLFIPSNYHGKNKLSDNKSWIKEINDIHYFSCNAHGHLHMTSDRKRFGECEFVEFRSTKEAELRLYEMWGEWILCDVLPSGWKNPGWLCTPESKTSIESICHINGFGHGKYKFDYVSLHYEHNQGMKWNCREFFGHDGIQEINIRTHNVSEQHPMGMIMLTSHIAGDWNHNVWNEDNFEQLCMSLDYLVENYDCEFKTLKECL